MEIGDKVKAIVEGEVIKVSKEFNTLYKAQETCYMIKNKIGFVSIISNPKIIEKE